VQAVGPDVCENCGHLTVMCLKGYAKSPKLAEPWETPTRAALDDVCLRLVDPRPRKPKIKVPGWPPPESSEEEAFNIVDDPRSGDPRVEGGRAE
jgi:hypothetical protein